MKWIDLHCDALNKRYLHKHHRFNNSGNFDVDFNKIIHSNIRMQTFAIYISNQITQNRIDHVLKQLTCFENIVHDCGFIKVLSKSDLTRCLFDESNWGAFLSLEGLDGLEQIEDELDDIYKRGLRSISLTWNNSNWAADGVYGTLNNGITKRGLNLIKKCEAMNICIDASHLSEKSFWDLLKYASKPIYCSHSNTNFVKKHPRNLTDAQIRAIINQNGVIGITFVPAFLSTNIASTIDDVIKNIYHICELGGESCIAFGSDFDGVEEHVSNLTNSGEMHHLYYRLREFFSLTQIDNFTWKNAYAYMFSNI